MGHKFGNSMDEGQRGRLTVLGWMGGMGERGLASSLLNPLSQPFAWVPPSARIAQPESRGWDGGVGCTEVRWEGLRDDPVPLSPMVKG